MDMFDEARAIRSTMQLCGLTQSALARQLGVSQSYVANKLRLLGFSDRVSEEIRKSGISERHARAILRLTSEDEQLRMIGAIRERGLTVRECEAAVDSAVMKNMPESIGRRLGMERIELFRAAIGRGVDLLRSAGVDANARTSYVGGDMYITVRIKDA